MSCNPIFLLFLIFLQDALFLGFMNVVSHILRSNCVVVSIIERAGLGLCFNHAEKLLTKGVSSNRKIMHRS